MSEMTYRFCASAEPGDEGTYYIEQLHDEEIIEQCLTQDEAALGAALLNELTELTGRKLAILQELTGMGIAWGEGD